MNVTLNDIWLIMILNVFLNSVTCGAVLFR